jgi:glycosyltransferase involved in cell wall biosynthesis
MESKISVIICTHNPRLDYISQVLEALKSQTLPLDVWELLLIDNASGKILASEIDISWHPQSRHIREEQLGLTPARLRGIKEASAEVLVFVDDDNVIEINYLETALQLGKDWPVLGAWGGQLIPKFEKDPPEWTKPHWGMLALYQFENDIWSNVLYAQTHPCGAGMCVRKVVANKYANLVQNDPRRINLDRKGKSLTGCGDTDLAFTACDIGLGMGRFTSLKLTHLIPPNRLEEDYLVKLTEGNAYSGIILRSLRGEIPSLPKRSWKGRLLELYYVVLMSSRERRFYLAKKQGESLAIQQLLQS